MKIVCVFPYIRQTESGDFYVSYFARHNQGFQYHCSVYQTADRALSRLLDLRAKIAC